jgi:hypothetical protein
VPGCPDQLVERSPGITRPVIQGVSVRRGHGFISQPIQFPGPEPENRDGAPFARPRAIGWTHWVTLPDMDQGLMPPRCED